MIRYNMMVPFTGLVLLVLSACGGQQQSTTTTTEDPVVEAEPTMVRFVHAVADGPRVQAYVGDDRIAEQGYRGYGNWVEVPSGEQDVTLRVNEGIELTDTYDFEPHKYYWIFAWGSMNPRGDEAPAAFTIAAEEDFGASTDDAWMRLANMTANGEAYGLTVTTGGSWQMSIMNQPIGTVSQYRVAPIQHNSFDVIPARDTSLPAVYSFEDDLSVGRLYNFVLLGRVGQNLDMIVINETAER